LTGCLLTGNKVRKLELVLARAQQQGCDTLITCGGLQSNHCRATALLGAQLGMKVCLILRGEPTAAADGNYLLSQLAGAEIGCYRAAEYKTHLDELLESKAAEYRTRGHKPWIIPTGASDATSIWGYIAASQELDADCRHHGLAPDWVISATGSGGTLAGLHFGHHFYSPRVGVLGMAVCDDAEHFRLKVARDIAAMCEAYGITQPSDLGKAELIDDYVGAGYAQASREVYDTIALLARTEGLVLDPVYTGKAFYGMLEEIKAGRFAGCSDIVFVHTGGVFGLFPYREALTPDH
jgi:D-cysteine desulfhydrase